MGQEGPGIPGPGQLSWASWPPAVLGQRQQFLVPGVLHHPRILWERQQSCGEGLGDLLPSPGSPLWLPRSHPRPCFHGHLCCHGGQAGAEGQSQTPHPGRALWRPSPPPVFTPELPINSGPGSHPLEPQGGHRRCVPAWTPQMLKSGVSSWCCFSPPFPRTCRASEAAPGL